MQNLIFIKSLKFSGSGWRDWKESLFQVGAVCFMLMIWKKVDLIVILILNTKFDIVSGMVIILIQNLFQALHLNGIIVH